MDSYPAYPTKSEVCSGVESGKYQKQVNSLNHLYWYHLKTFSFVLLFIFVILYSFSWRRFPNYVSTKPVKPKSVLKHDSGDYKWSSLEEEGHVIEGEYILR